MRTGSGGTNDSTQTLLEEWIFDIICNAYMPKGELWQVCNLQDEGQSLIWAAMSQLNLSARAYHRILKLARTIADLTGSERSSPRTWRRRCSIAPS